MTKIGQVEIAEGLPPIKISDQKSTIHDFNGNEDVFKWFQHLRILAKNWDETILSTNVAEESKK